FDRDFGLIARRKIDNYVSAANGDKLNRVESPMRQAVNSFCDRKSAQNWPARRIDAIAANFFARKFLALEHNGLQSRGGAKGCAGRSSRSAADNCNIENFHLWAVS